MFEDFSFVSSSTTIPTDPNAAYSAYLDQLDPLSPLSSNCASPPISNTRRSRDVRYHASRTPSIGSPSPSRRLSIDTLTSHFDNISPFEALNIDHQWQPQSGPVDEDEGFYEPADNHLYRSTIDIPDCLAPLSAFDYSLSSSISSSTSRPLWFAARRRQRQILTRLQCINGGRLDAHLTMLLEECHPSSLPLNTSDSDSEKCDSSPSSVTSASYSVPLGSCVASNTRVEKRSAVVKRAPRLRKRKP